MTATVEIPKIKNGIYFIPGIQNHNFWSPVKGKTEEIVCGATFMIVVLYG